MSKININEIKKEFETAMKLGDAPIGKYFACTISKLTAKETIDYINQLEADKEEYVKDYDELENKLKYSEVDRKFQYQRVRYLQADIQLLQDKITELQHEIKTTKSAAIKEFAERLKMKWDITNWDNPYGCSFKVIDNLVKEMAGEE